MTTHRMRRAVHPGDSSSQEPVTGVYAGGVLIGANVWSGDREVAVLVRVGNLKRVAEGLFKLLEQRRAK